MGLTPADERGMDALGLKDVYALAGTFSNDGEKLTLGSRRRFLPGKRRLYLVYRFDAGGVHRALDDAPRFAAEAIARAYDEDRRSAEAAGWRVAGCQVDLDCPTRRLESYARILQELRPQIRGELSITGLATWLGGRVDLPLRFVHFWSPQMYEFAAPRRLGEAPVSAAGWIGRYRARLDALGVPYRLGIASHGQALAYRNGVLEGSARGLAPSEAAARFRAAPLPPMGEEAAGYAIPDGRTLVYRRPSVEETARALREAEGIGSGAVLFRVPAPGEELTPPLASLLPPERGFPVEVKAADAGSPFAAIERGAQKEAREVTLSFRWKAAGDPPLRNDAVRIELSFPAGEVASLAPGDFGGLRLVGEGSGPTSLARATGAWAEVPRVRGEMRLGPILRSRAGILRVRVAAHVDGGRARVWEGSF